MTASPRVLFRPEIQSLKHLHSGKVRDLYEIDEERMLIVASDRLSAFDVVLPTPIPGKGEILTELSNFWFGRTRDIIPNHLLEVDLAEVLPDPEERAQVEGRSVVARRLQALPIEAIVRGYLIGSGWKDYQQDETIGGLTLPMDLQLADRLPQPVFTPSTKAADGSHDVNIGFREVAERIGEGVATQVRSTSLRLYEDAAAYAAERGIIIADTKFEFGLDAAGDLVLIDELLTPDSSRFWPSDRWQPGQNPPSFDKQFIRDWLEGQDWDKQPPGPELPDEIVAETVQRYHEALRRLTEN